MRKLWTLIPLLLALPAFAADPAASAAVADPLAERLSERLQEPVTSPVKPASKSTMKGEGMHMRAKSEMAKKPALKASDAKPALPDAAHWAYTGAGAPEHWAELSPDNKLCGVGIRQSPIDIRDTIRVDQEKLQFDYHPSSFAVLDDGHAIVVSVGQGNFLTVMGQRYELSQIIFHRPGEIRVQGRSYDMDAQLIHKDPDGKLAIVDVMLQRGLDDMGQSVVQTVLNNLPLERNMPLQATVPLDASLLLPKQQGYFAFMGSLTRPPCSEEVLWLVIRQPGPLSSDQSNVFAHLYPMNARPLQANSGRLIKESK